MNRMDIPVLPPRTDDSHKGDYGRVVIVAGSVGMAGAAALAGMSALRSGAGLVTVATAKSCQDVVAGFHPALMTVGLPADDSGRISVDSYAALQTHVPAADCLAIGPGMGQSSELHNLLADVYAAAELPVVIDADGLNNLSGRLASQNAGLESIAPLGPRVLTPHPGEFRRFLSEPGGDRPALELAAQRLASAAVTIVLKGFQSMITGGGHSAHNLTGNPGMATAGSGDVLTGIIAALIGQGLSIFDACVLACHVHGLAGDLAKLQVGEVGLVATDLIDQLPEAFLRQQ